MQNVALSVKVQTEMDFQINTNFNTKQLQSIVLKKPMKKTVLKKSKISNHKKTQIVLISNLKH